MWRGKLGAPRVNPEVLGFTRARAHTKGPERMKPCMLCDTSQQHANFVGLAYQGKDIVFRFIIKYNSLKDFGP
jgi:hypothetical protein